MTKKASTLLLFIFLFGCLEDDTGLPPGKRGGGFSLADEKKMAFAIAQMESKSIPFEIGENGSVWYMQENKAEVLGIIRQAQYGDMLKDNVIESAVITSDLELKLYIKRFKEEKIPFNLDTFEGVKHISWLQIYGPQADRIIQEVGFERAKHYN